MRRALVFLLAIFLSGSVLADEQTRVLQERLREQGFYYGEVDGREGDETSAAIRRYQIRHGLRVTGQANDETLRSLGVSRESGVRPAPEYQNDRRYYDQEQNNENYRRQPVRPYNYQQQPIPEDYQDIEPPYYRSPGVSTSYPRLFAGTIYERAPIQVQENVVFAAQGELLKRGFYHGIIDGQLGPAINDAIARFQQDQGMPITGRLDMDTLNELRALPGQRNGPPRNGPPEEGFRRLPGGGRIYRGIPVQ
jgi:peptidoglycan hydrolase-like protein with peptidoglycan-binding domain